MKKALANPDINQPKRASARVRLAKVVVAKHSYSKKARQAAFSKAVSHVSAAKAVARAKLIPSVNPSEFRIIRMPG